MTPIVRDVPSGFELRNIHELSAPDVARFVLGLARSEGWALEIVDARLSDGPFDRLAAYWVGLTPAHRRAIADGLLCYFDFLGYPPEDSTVDGNEGLRDGLAFTVNIIPDVDEDTAERFIRPLRFWLRRGEEEDRRLAASALASVKSFNALAILQSEAEKLNQPVWILPSILEARAKLDPFLVFDESAQWLPQALKDIRARSGLQQAIKRMAARNLDLAIGAVSATASVLDKESAAELVKLVSELRIPGWGLSQAEPSAPQPKSESKPAFDGLIESLNRVRAANIAREPEQEIAQAWRRILVSLPNDPRERLPKWKLIRAVVTEAALDAVDDRFLAGLRTAVFGDPENRDQYELLRDAQRDFYEARLRPPPAAHRAVEVIKKRLEGRITTLRSLKSGRIPRELRIPTVIYAEEAYMETFRLLLRTYFDRLDVERITHVDWDKLDSKISDNVCDLGLNNDDILSHRDGPDVSLVRLNGPPLYVANDFLIIARRTFIEQLGFPVSTAQAIGSDGLLSGLSMFDLFDALKALLSSGQVSVPKETLLHTTMNKLVDQLGFNGSDCISAEPSDKGLIDFFTGEVPMYFGGSLQTGYALRTWDEAMPLCRLSLPGVEGRLFARADLLDNYPDFMQDIADLTTELQYAFGQIPHREYKTAFRYHLVEDLNSALFESSQHNVTAVEDFDQLTVALAQSNLQHARLGERRWSKWSSSQDRSGTASLRLVEGTRR